MGTLATFDREYTCAVQKTLCLKQGVDLTIDGDFGAKSIAALKSYQASNGLAISGLYDPATRAVLEPFLLSKFLTTPDYTHAAAELGVPIASIKAFQETEAAGSGFLPSTKPKILFERHWFASYLKQAKPAQYPQLQAANPDIINTATGGYAGGEAEWKRFNRAFAIDPQSAMMSTSWGLFQIMGFNFNFAGFTDVGTMVDAMKISEMKQLAGFVNFIKKYRNGDLWKALKAQDWDTVARIYNGPANVPVYSRKLKTWFDYFAAYYGTK